MLKDPMDLARDFPAAPRYLIHMYLMVREGEEISNARIARKMAVSAPAVTQSLRRMVGLGLLEQSNARRYDLTDYGRTVADRIISRHYLLECLLVNELGVPWDMADEESDHLQISLSGRLEEFLVERLGHPQTCPHGNPFPGSPMEEKLLHAPALDQFDEGDVLRLVRVTEEGEMVPGLLTSCVQAGIELGCLLRLESDHKDDAGESSAAGQDREAVITVLASGAQMRLPTLHLHHFRVAPAEQ